MRRISFLPIVEAAEKLLPSSFECREAMLIAKNQVIPALYDECDQAAQTSVDAAKVAGDTINLVQDSARLEQDCENCGCC